MRCVVRFAVGSFGCKLVSGKDRTFLCPITP